VSSSAPAYTIARPSPSNALAGRRDEAMVADVRDALANDLRTAHLTLDVSGRGGVVHLTGTVDEPAEREVVRRLVRRVTGVRCAWDLVAVAGEDLRVADVGCGGTKQVEQAIGVDVQPGPGVDVVADLDHGLPFEDDALDHVFAVHVLEHVRDLLGVMRELHRVLRPTGLLHVLCPLWTDVNAVADPTHVRGVDVQTFKYFTSARPGVLPWRPLIATKDASTVHVDLQPVKDGGEPPGPGELARWFS
jgi:SAM-dependent methyltransferase